MNFSQGSLSKIAANSKQHYFTSPAIQADTAPFSPDKPISEKKQVSMGGDDALFIVREAAQSTRRKGVRVHLGDGAKGAQCWDPHVHTTWEVKVLQGKAPSHSACQDRSDWLLEQQAPPASYCRTPQRFGGKQDLPAAAARQTGLARGMSSSRVIFLFSSGASLI